MKPSALLLGTLVLLCSCGPEPSLGYVGGADDLDPLPAWDYADAAGLVTSTEGICGVSPIREEHADEVRLLAWRTLEDERPLRVDQALWWARFTGPGGQPYWVLASGFRHPEEEQPRDRLWQLSFICDSPHQPLRVYRTPPTGRDALALVRGTWSGFEGFRVLEAGVRRHTWAITLGDPPPQPFRP